MLTLKQIKTLISIAPEHQYEIIKADGPVTFTSDNQGAVETVDARELQKALSQRQDLTRKTYDRLVINGVLSTKDLLKRPTLSQAEQECLADCELTDDEVQQLLARPEICSTAVAELIGNGYLDISGILKKPRLTIADQNAICMAGTKTDKRKMIAMKGLSPDTITRLADTGFFLDEKGHMTPEFKLLADDPSYQIALGRSHKRYILEYLADLPNLQHDTFFAIANVEPLNSDYAPITLKLVERPDCPIEIPAFYANLPEAVGYYERKKEKPLSELMAVSSLLCTMMHSPRAVPYRNLKEALMTTNIINNPKTTRVKLFAEFMPAQRIYDSIDQYGGWVADIPVHIYSLPELAAKAGLNVEATEQMLKPILSRINNTEVTPISPVSAMPKTEASWPDIDLLKDGVYAFTNKMGQTRYADIRAAVSTDTTPPMITVHCKLYRLLDNISGEFNAGDARMQQYNEYVKDPDGWKKREFTAGIEKYLKVQNEAEYKKYKEAVKAGKTDAWLKAHPEITPDLLEKSGCMLPVPVKPELSQYNIANVQIEDNPSDWFVTYEDFMACKPVFKGWSKTKYSTLTPGLAPEKQKWVSTHSEVKETFSKAIKKNLNTTRGDI